MAILKMQKINIFALNKNCKGVLELLQRVGAIQIEKADVKQNVFYNEDTKLQQSVYKRNAATISNAKEILNSYTSVKKSLFATLKGRRLITKDEYYRRSEEYSEVLNKAYKIIKSDKKISEYKAKINTYLNKIQMLAPWKNLDVPIQPFTTKHTKVIFGSLPKKYEYHTLYESIYKIDGELEGFELEIVSSDDNQTYVFVLCMISDFERLMNALSKMGFISSMFSTDLTVQEEILTLEEKITHYKQKIQKCKEEIAALTSIRESFDFFEDYFIMKSDCYAQIENIMYSPHTFLLTGYIPECRSYKLSQYLQKEYGAYVELEDATSEDVPTILVNNKFTEPVEGVVLSYSPPNRKELDPTGVMAFFYYVFFGMMFSDAGYGLVMALGCSIAVRVFKNMEEGLKRSFRMFFWCGVSTLMWGLLFGSFFGDVVKVIANNFFGVEAPIIPGITEPIWFNPTEGAGPTKLLMFSFLLGLVHLFSGLLMQAVNYIRLGKIKYAIYDDLSWILLVCGVVLALLSTRMLGSLAGFMLPPVWLTVGCVIAGVGAVIILFFSGKSKNPFKRFIKGAYNLYGATSYLSDVLSYSRLLALGLATGVVAQVFNQLGSMFGNTFLGVVGFIIVFIIGHSLNIGINALGAYVHTNRLQFVEFFGKFYEGGGREFTPFSVKTKKYNIKEEF